MNQKIEPQALNGQRYLSPFQLAHWIGRSENTIYRLINKGNGIRRMKCSYEFFGRPLIPFEELTEFPHTGKGRYAERDVYHFNLDGEAVPCEICSISGPGLCVNTAPSHIGSSLDSFLNKENSNE